MSNRTNRASYPDYIKTMTRFTPGDLQKEYGIPASITRRLREGSIETVSDSIALKFQKVFNQYWEYRLDKAGVTPDNWTPLITQADSKELRETVREYENTRKWDRALDRGGVNPVEREAMLRTDTERELRERIDKNRETAEKIIEKRRERDKNLPGYSDSWHTVDAVLKQMARDTSKISSDWAWFAKYGSPKRKKARYAPEPGKRRSKRSPQYEH
jgi:hypothetical protein